MLVAFEAGMLQHPHHHGCDDGHFAGADANIVAGRPVVLSRHSDQCRDGSSYQGGQLRIKCRPGLLCRMVVMTLRVMNSVTERDDYFGCGLACLKNENFRPGGRAKLLRSLFFPHLWLDKSLALPLKNISNKSTITHPFAALLVCGRLSIPMKIESERLAIDGGKPLRDQRAKPWPSWPQTSAEEWRSRVEPALRKVYISGVEGLPGTKAQEFASKLASYCHAAYARMVPHGTDALAAALAGALDLDGWGDAGELILPNYTFIATASAALDRRFTLAFVDVDPNTFTIDPDAVERAILPGRTRAIMAVHLGGHPANMARLKDIGEKHNLKVLEDAAQAHGAICDGKPVGSHGHAAAFSFQSSKNLTCGEGGAVTTNEREIDARVSAFMDVGRLPRGERWAYSRLGWNHRPSEYLAALLLVRLEDLEQQTQHRERMAKMLSKALANIPGATPPRPGPWCTRHAYHLYAMLLDPKHFGGRSRDQISQAVRAEGVPCHVGYTRPLSQSPALTQIKQYSQTMRVLDCPVTRWICDRSLWLPQNLLLGDEEDMSDIAAALAKVQRGMQ